MYNVEELIENEATLVRLGAITGNPGEDAILRSAKVKVTPRCNLKCAMCSYWRYPKQDEMSPDQLAAIVDQFAGMGMRKVHFSGGEPLLREDMLDVIERCADRKIRANITTNGTLVDGEKAKALIKAGIRSVSVSLDGPTSKVHDGIRGVPGAFKKAISAVERLAVARDRYSSKKRVRVRINTVLQRDNWRHFPELVKLAGELGADEIHPMPVDPKDKSQLIKKSEIKDFNLCVAPEVESLRIKYGFSTHPLLLYPFGESKAEIKCSVEGLYGRGFFNENLCYAPWLHMFVCWDGETYPCCMTRGRVPSLGNVATTGVEGVFHGPGFTALRRNFVKHRLNDCARCDNFLYENTLLAEALHRHGQVGSLEASTPP